MEHLNKLATLKEIGAIEYRIADQALDQNIRLHVIRRSLDNLIDTTPRKFWGILAQCRRALEAGDMLELVAGCALVRSMVPVTWGMLPAGYETTIGRKTKAGRVVDGVTYEHPLAATRVVVL
jgi:hypothetical protein